MWIADHINSADFIPETLYQAKKENLKDSVLNTMYANQIYRKHPMDYHGDFENCMLDKYRLAGMEVNQWKDIKIHPKNDSKAINLMKELGLQEGKCIKDYILVNENSQAGSVEINPIVPKGVEVVKMRFIPGYNVIDWYWVIQSALENHHVSTSTFFIMQAISRSYFFDSKVFIYPRPNEDGLRGISNLVPGFHYTKM